jgi:hypothetical protein
MQSRAAGVQCSPAVLRPLYDPLWMCSCLGDERECSVCQPEARKVADMLRFQEQSAANQEQFFKQVCATQIVCAQWALQRAISISISPLATAPYPRTLIRWKAAQMRLAWLPTTLARVCSTRSAS